MPSQFVYKFGALLETGLSNAAEVVVVVVVVAIIAAAPLFLCSLDTTEDGKFHQLRFHRLQELLSSVLLLLLLTLMLTN